MIAVRASLLFKEGQDCEYNAALITMVVSACPKGGRGRA